MKMCTRNELLLGVLRCEEVHTSKDLALLEHNVTGAKLKGDMGGESLSKRENLLFHRAKR